VDVPLHDNSQPLDVSKDQFEDFSDFNDEFSSIDDDSFSIDNIENVKTLAKGFCTQVFISSASIGNHWQYHYSSDSSLYDSFIFDLSINPFHPADRSDFYQSADEVIHIISLPEYDCFFFKIEPNSRDFTMDVVEDISPTREPRVHNA
nr:hypothetical protein [Tanacetum cinerariifolium]